MKIKDIVKKQTTVIALAVMLVVVAAIGISYAIFFDVKESADTQVLTAGSLNLNVAGVSALSLNTPVSDSVGLSSTPVSYTIENSGTLPANYTLYIYENSDNALSLNNIKISTDGNATKGNTAKTLGSITDKFTENGKTYYKITDTKDIAGNTTNSTPQYIRVWVDESSLSSEMADVKVSLNLYVVSEVKE